MPEPEATMAVSPAVPAPTITDHAAIITPQTPTQGPDASMHDTTGDADGETNGDVDALVKPAKRNPNRKRQKLSKTALRNLKRQHAGLEPKLRGSRKSDEATLLARNKARSIRLLQALPRDHGGRFIEVDAETAADDGIGVATGAAPMDAPTDAPTVADAATSASADPVDVAPSLADPPSGIVTSRKAEQARAYLRTFVEDKAQWKFAKLQQVWLLQNLWFVPLLPTTEFETRMLPYLASLPAGPARASTIAEAHRVIAAYRVTVANQKKAAKAAAKAAELAAKQTADESTASMDAAATPSATTTPSPPPPMKVMTTAEIVAAGKAAQLDRAAAALKAPEHDAGAIADPADVVEEANHDMYQRARQVLAVFDETVESEDEEDDDESTDKTLSKKEKSKKSKKSKKEKKDKKDKKDKKRKERDE